MLNLVFTVCETRQLCKYFLCQILDFNAQYLRLCVFYVSINKERVLFFYNDMKKQIIFRLKYVNINLHRYILLEWSVDGQRACLTKCRDSPLCRLRAVELNFDLSARFDVGMDSETYNEAFVYFSIIVGKRPSMTQFSFAPLDCFDRIFTYIRKDYKCLVFLYDV